MTGFGQGISYLGAPIATALSTRFQCYRRVMIVSGWLCCIFGLVGASFAQTVPELIATQGVVYGIGIFIYYYPFLCLLNEWWDKRRGLAYGILFGANGISGLCLPYIVDKLLHKYGYATALRCYAIGAALVTLPALAVLGSRFPKTNATLSKSPPLLPILLSFKFWSFAASNLLQGIASSIPSIFLPTFASALSLPSFAGPLLLALFNLFQSFSNVLLGYLSDNFPVPSLLFISSLSSGLCVFLLWGLVPFTTPLLPLLVLFAVLYGATAGGYTALYARMATALTADEETKRTLYGVWCFERGVGNVLAGPLSGVLVGAVVEMGAFGAGRFAGLVAFTGACLVGSAVAVIGGLLPERGRKEKEGEGEDV